MFVHEQGSSDISTCGTTTNPCNSLKKGISKVKESGTVLIQGDQQLNATIRINKSVTIRGISGKRIKLMPRNGSKFAYAFEISNSINVSFVSLSVERVGLLFGAYAGKRCRVALYLTDSHIVNTTYPGYRYPIKFSRTYGVEVSVFLVNSVFRNTGQISTKNYWYLVVMKHLHIVNTTFEQSAGIAVYGVSTEVKIVGSNFIATSLLFSGIRREIAMVAIKNTSLVNTQLRVQNIHGAMISRCNVTGARGVSPLVIGGSREVWIKEVMCERNEVDGDGGCMRFTREWVTQRSINILHSTFRYNRATKNGGAISAQYSHMNITNCVFVGNKARTGGALHLSLLGDWDSPLDGIITSSRFERNRALSKGGAIYTREGKSKSKSVSLTQ